MNGRFAPEADIRVGQLLTHIGRGGGAPVRRPSLGASCNALLNEAIRTRCSRYVGATYSEPIAIATGINSRLSVEDLRTYVILAKDLPGLEAPCGPGNHDSPESARTT
jgi:hypothetical protein